MASSMISRAQLEARSLRVPIRDDLEPEQEAASSHVPDAFEPLLKGEQARPELFAPDHGLLDQPVALDHIEDRQADRRRQRVGHVGRVEEEPSLVRLLFDLLGGHDGGKGRPAPRVFDSVMISGVTPSRWKANMWPVRPTPVWASSRISSMPRSSHFCFNAAR